MPKTIDHRYDRLPTYADFLADIAFAAVKGQVTEAYCFPAPGATDGSYITRVHFEEVDEDLLADTATEREL